MTRIEDLINELKTIRDKQGNIPVQLGETDFGLGTSYASDFFCTVGSVENVKDDQGSYLGTYLTMNGKKSSYPFDFEEERLEDGDPVLYLHPGDFFFPC